MKPEIAAPKKLFMTLMDIGIKNKGRVQLFDESCIDADGKPIPFETQLAIVTHYLITEGTPYADSFDKAKDFIKLWSGDRIIKRNLPADVVCDLDPSQH